MSTLSLIEMNAFGSRVVPVHVSGHLESTLETVNLRVIATPPHYNKTIGLWNLELEYQVWDLSQVQTNPQWKQLTQFSSTSSLVVVKRTSYYSIQAAVDSALPGSIVIVDAGYYTEDVHINRPLKLMARKNGHGKTLIFGQVLIESSNVTVDGFLFHTMNSFKPSLIVVNSSSISIQNCEFRSDQENKFLSQSNHHHQHHPSAVHLQNSVNSRVINSFFKDCSLGLTIDNCTECSSIGNTFSSCIAAGQILSSHRVSITRNYFVRNTVALEVDSFKHLTQILNENIFEKNSVMIKKGKLFSRKELEVALDRPIRQEKDSLSFEGPESSPKVLIYGSCEVKSEEDVPDTCISIRGEFCNAIMII